MKAKGRELAGQMGQLRKNHRTRRTSDSGIRDAVCQHPKNLVLKARRGEDRVATTASKEVKLAPSKMYAKRRRAP